MKLFHCNFSEACFKAFGGYASYYVNRKEEVNFSLFGNIKELAEVLSYDNEFEMYSDFHEASEYSWEGIFASVFDPISYIFRKEAI